jgi:hypothetical protein
MATTTKAKAKRTRKPPLTWRSRPVADVLASGTRRRRWSSPSGYRVEEHVHSGLPTVWLALCIQFCTLPPHILPVILGRHRTRRAALATCEKHWRRQS